MVQPIITDTPTGKKIPCGIEPPKEQLNNENRSTKVDQVLMATHTLILADQLLKIEAWLAANPGYAVREIDQ